MKKINININTDGISTNKKLSREEYQKLKKEGKIVSPVKEEPSYTTLKSRSIKNNNIKDNESKITKKKKTKNKKIRKKKKTRLRPWFFITLFLIFSIILLINLLIILKWNNDNKDIEKLEEDIKEDLVITEIEEEGELVNPPEEDKSTPTVISDYWYYVSVPFTNVDFTSLLSKNSDTIAFIKINNTNVNYPVVQTNNNDFYLNHAYDKSYNEAGWIYLDYRNNKDLSLNDNSIIYGHGRINKTVFGSLRNTLDKSWQNNKDNHTISISTPYKNYVYQIFSIYTIKSETYYITTKFSKTYFKEKWIKEMKKRNTSTIETEVTTEDKVLTLSTCLNDDDVRIVVHAKLIKQQNK